MTKLMIVQLLLYFEINNKCKICQFLPSQKKNMSINFSLCEAYGFAFICNGNIDRNRLWRDGIHLKNEGTSLLSKNVLEYLNTSSEHLANPSEYGF